MVGLICFVVGLMYRFGFLILLVRVFMWIGVWLLFEVWYCLLLKICVILLDDGRIGVYCRFWVL